ncbi:hypothetical protein, partial [Bacillus sp. J14TS2]|uniref:hypothetical protein n=1 Tax=Bacillus sp. J14TS2 TaxID=2807188 RepID=UPI0035B52F04
MKDEKVIRKINVLMNEENEGLKDIRKLVHQLEPSTVELPLIQNIKQLVDKFMESTDISVKFRCFGDEYSLS